MISTPWQSTARGAVLVNGEAVRAGWSRDGRGRPTCRHGAWMLAVIPNQSGALSLEVRNAGSEPADLGTVHFGRWSPESFSVPLRTGEFRELVHGASFLSMDCGVKPVGRPTPLLAHVAPGSLFIVYQREGGPALLLGILPPAGGGFSEFVTVHSDPHLEGLFGFEIRHVFNCLVSPGESVKTSPIIGICDSDGTELMRTYGELWHEALGRPSFREPCVGWNSWDFYAGNVTRQAIEENLAAAREIFGDRLKVIVIDEGWETQWGTWEANLKFPGGIEDFCRHVKQQGLIPGLWTAPLLVNTYNPLFLERPDWFASQPDGQLQTDRYSYGPMAYLDVTRPEVLEHVRGIFRRLRSAGVEYFKVDFSHCILNAKKFADPRVGRNELIRRAFQTIRDAIGPDAYLLSCGSPFESVIGLVNAVRSTGDIHNYWGHVLRNAGQLSVRWWMHRRLWNCDPDFMVVRGPDTADPPLGKRALVKPAELEGGWAAGRTFNEMEARTWALLVHLSGGDVMLGDRLRGLCPNALDMIRRVLTPRTNAAVPVDLFESEQDLPRTWISRGEQDSLVGVFNWLDKPAAVCLDPARYGLSGTPRDFWTDQPVASLPNRMPRRSSIALRYAH